MSRLRGIESKRSMICAARLHSMQLSHQKYYSAHGFGTQAKAASEAAARKDTIAMLKAIPDEMVTTFALAGTPDEVCERVGRMWEHGNSMTLSAPQYFVPQQRINEYREALVETLYKTT